MVYYKTFCFNYQYNKLLYHIIYLVIKMIPNRLRDLRDDKDLKQKDLANYLNCSQVAYSHYELGKRDIPNEVLIALAKFYNTTTDYILGLTDDISPRK